MFIVRTFITSLLTNQPDTISVKMCDCSRVFVTSTSHSSEFPPDIVWWDFKAPTETDQNISAKTNQASAENKIIALKKNTCVNMSARSVIIVSITGSRYPIWRRLTEIEWSYFDCCVSCSLESSLKTPSDKWLLYFVGSCNKWLVYKLTTYRLQHGSK